MANELANELLNVGLVSGYFRNAFDFEKLKPNLYDNGQLTTSSKSNWSSEQ